jgi:hypothetical protein
MTVRVPASAPLTPPLTGASANATPFPANRSAMRREEPGSPDVQSISSAPGWKPCSSPSGPLSKVSTSREVGRQVITMSAPLAASRGVVTIRAPCAEANSAARATVRFHTVRDPRAARCTAIGQPMAPRPRKLTGFIRTLSGRHASSRIGTLSAYATRPALLVSSSCRSQV